MARAKQPGARGVAARKKSTAALEPQCRLVRFRATDGVELPGLLYEPARPSSRIVIWLHGTGGASIFDASRTNLIAAELLARGVAFLPFNNRGAHVLRRLRRITGNDSESIAGGSAHELIGDCVFDIDGAIRFARERGYSDVTLAGHSTGANKIALYNARKPRNAASRYVLLAGGDDTGLHYAQLGAKRFAAALTKARAMIESGRGDELAPAALSPVPLSWSSLLDMLDPDGDYNVFPFLEAMRGRPASTTAPFRFVKTIRKPTLVVYGENDEYCYGDVTRCVAILEDVLDGRPNFAFAIIPGADHGFSGHEITVAAMLAKFVSA
jgi:pimeloyl-ACP methyl ester carboxylesterase